MAVSITPGAAVRRKGPIYTDLFFQVVVAIIIGGLLGLVFKGQHWITEYLKPLGDNFIKLVKMIIAPVIFLTISLGIANMRDMGKLGRVTLKAFGYFLFFSTLALIVGLIVANVWQTGAGMNIDPASLDGGDLAKVADYERKAEGTSLVGFLSEIIPSTLVGAFTGGSILQVVFVSILFGVGLALAGDRAMPAVDILTSVSDAIFKMVSILMRVAPIGALGAFAFVISNLGIEAVGNLLELVVAVYLTSFLFIFGVLGVVGMLAGFSIFRLVVYLKEELFLVLGTSSSESALPALMDKMERAGCARSVVGLVVPTGYSFNLDGTNIYMTLAALFIAQATNIHLSLENQLILLGIAMLSSKGAAGVTGAGFIALAATLEQVHSIPVEGMALILGVDRFLSQCRALTNFVGNAIATIVVSRWEGALDPARLKHALSGGSPPLAAAPVEQDAD
ncbi:MAG: C4-dicarboxylate transporter DctA [Alphaproteobacteria bacterium]|nr:C4-dicarboxylate transporter DctA [Alphaproteobacteria bacterium]